MLTPMRTTLDIDDDVLQAAKELAEARGTSAGKVLSALARKGLAAQAGAASGARTRNGVPVLASRGPDAPRVTMRQVNALRDEP